MLFYAFPSSILDGISNIYMLSTTTMFLAIIIAFYCANFLTKEKTTSETEINYENEEENSECNNKANECAEDLEHINANAFLGKFRAAKLKQTEANLTEEQMEEEHRVEREQLAAIFELLKKQQDELDIQKMDEAALQQQLKLYR